MSFCNLTKGITPTICRLCICVTNNKRSLEPFMFSMQNETLNASRSKRLLYRQNKKHWTFLGANVFYADRTKHCKFLGANVFYADRTKRCQFLGANVFHAHRTKHCTCLGANVFYADRTKHWTFPDQKGQTPQVVVWQIM